MRINTKITAAITAFATIAVFAFSACNRNKNTEEDTGYASDHATLEKTFSDVQSIADQASDDNGSLSTYKVANATVLSQCATVSVDTTANPHKITIDFGTNNCLCKDGIYRRGQIIVTYTGRYRDMGHTHTITFNNYFVNDNQVTGSKTVTYSSKDASDHPVYTIVVNGSVILANNAGTISWQSNRTRTWVAGSTTASWSDDEYDITGTSTVTRANGNTFAINITTPLHVALNCRWIESGSLTITPVSGNTRVLDYGNGTCDAAATFTVNGKTYNVTLR